MILDIVDDGRHRQIVRDGPSVRGLGVSGIVALVHLSVGQLYSDEARAPVMPYQHPDAFLKQLEQAFPGFQSNVPGTLCVHRGP